MTQQIVPIQLDLNVKHFGGSMKVDVAAFLRVVPIAWAAELTLTTFLQI